MASKWLKGLTVEIGGDTTKLSKALEGVNKKSKDLSSELTQINKLLKLDPGNADLLAQKQKVLTDAIDATAEKLETLREAEKQVQKQFEKGEVSQEQVRALQREIIATTKKLDDYERAAQETADAIKQLGESSEDAQDGTKKASKGADQAADSLDDLADSADEAGEASEGLGSKLGSLASGGLKLLTAGVAAATGALVASAEASREYRAEIGKLETGFDAAGHSAETATATYKTLQGVIGETDQSVEAAQQIALLAQSAEDAAKWADLAAGVVGRFGDALQPETFFEAANETLKLNESTAAYTQMLEQAGYDVEKFNAGLQACTTVGEKQAYMLRITDEILGDAADKYREVNGEVIRANEANEAWASVMGEVGGVIEPILTDVKLMGAALLSEAVPGIRALTDAFRGMMNGDAGASGEFSEALSGMVTGLLDKLTQALPTIATVGFSIIQTLATSLLQQLPTLLTTGGQMVSQLLGGIASNLPNLVQTGLNLIGNLVQSIQTGLPLVLERGREILMNLATGIKESLPSLVSQGLDILMNFATTLYDNAPMLIQTGFDVLSNLVTGIINSIPALLSKGPEIISKFANIINDNFPTILKKGAELLWQIITGLISVIPDLIANAGKIVTAIIDVWEAINWVNLGKKIITFFKDGILKMVSAVKNAGKSIGTSVTDALKNLPQNLLNMGKNAITKLGSALSSGVATVKSGAAQIFNGILTSFQNLPSKLLTIGKDLVKGLWNGISDMAGWVINKIKGFGESVLSGIKSFFGIKSPSRVFRDEVGAMLAEGMAEGIEANADAPLDAMAGLSSDLLGEAESLNGLTLERKLQHTFAEPAVDSGINLMDKLDRILAAIERGQILTIDGKAFIGATADGYDAKMGQRRALVARGAL